MSVGLGSWDKLPNPILVHIFSFLPLNDRRNAAVVCKSWCKTLNSPQLWETLFCIFCVTRNPALNVPFCRNLQAYKVVSRVSECIKMLIIKWVPNYPRILNESIQNQSSYKLATFFKRLLEDGKAPQLHKLCLIGGGYSDFNDEDEALQDLILSTTKFLRRQHQLVSVTIEWQLNILHGSLLLDALVVQSSTSMIELNLKDCFLHQNFILNRKRNPDTIKRYLLPYSNLIELHLAYEDLGVEVLLTLTKNCSQSLSRLVIYYFMDITSFMMPLDHHKIPCEVWHSVKMLAPQLKVNFNLGTGDWNVESIKEVLPSAVPLVSLNYSETKPKSTCIEYFQTFEQTLEEIVLDLEVVYYYLVTHNGKHIPNRSPDPLDSATIQLVKACTHLKSLCIRAKLDIAIIHKIFELRVNEITGLANLSILFLDLTPEEIVKLEILKEEYEYLKHAHIIHYKFDWERSNSNLHLQYES